MAIRNAAPVLFGLTAALSLIAALLPLFRGRSVNAVYLGGAVVFFIIALAVRRGRPPASPPGPGA